MKIELITMPKSEARKKIKEYRTDLARRQSQEYQQILRGYKALESGLSLMHLSKSIQAGGFHESMMPRLAIAPADRKVVHFSWDSHSQVGVYDTNQPYRHRSDRMAVRVNLGRAHGLRSGADRRVTLRGKAMVPIVPPRARLKKDLTKLFILWEEDKWKVAEPAADPALLKHVGGDLYAVLSTWDLTDLERAVIFGGRDRLGK